MKQYLKMFTESGYMTPKDILYLANEDLEALGVGLIGHRKKLLKAIKNTKNQVSKFTLHFFVIPFIHSFISH